MSNINQACQPVNNSDIAEVLEVNPSSVTKMIQKLDKDQYLIYEKYRGLILTNKGKRVGKKLLNRHQILEEFLRIMGIDNEELIYHDVEGIEHHLSPESIIAIESLVHFFKENTDLSTKFLNYRKIHEANED